ncbi:MAG: Crp/Fnr family transcriptional regulator [Lutibacter sp.]
MKIEQLIYDNFANLFEEKLLHEIALYGILKKAEPDKIVLEVRRKSNFIPIIIKGIVKVKRRDGKGNGIFIQYLSDKQSSALAITNAFKNENCSVRLMSFTAVKYVLIPVKVVNTWFDKYPSWRAYFMSLNQDQTKKNILQLSNVAFLNLEERLVKYLEETARVTKDKLLVVKHFDIARDIKASRESVSRTLKKLEQDKKLILSRNKIKLLF